AEDGIRDKLVTGVQTCALPISSEGVSVAQNAPKPSREMPRSDNHLFGCQLLEQGQACPRRDSGVDLIHVGQVRIMQLERMDGNVAGNHCLRLVAGDAYAHVTRRVTWTRKHHDPWSDLRLVRLDQLEHAGALQGCELLFEHNSRLLSPLEEGPIGRRSDVAGAREVGPPVGSGPTDVVDMQVGEEDDLDRVGRDPSSLELGGEPTLTRR